MNAKALLAGGLVTGLLALAGPAQAGSVGISVVFGGGHHHGHHHGSPREAFRAGYDRGHERGFEHGLRDARRRRGFDYAHDGDYRNADRGYRCAYGPRQNFISGYREGYEDGYRRGFRSARVERHRHGSRWCSERHHDGNGWGHRHDSRCERDGRCDRGERWRERERGDDDRDWRDDDHAVRRCDPRDENCDR
jgi:hypothetical protein